DDLAPAPEPIAPPARPVQIQPARAAASASLAAPSAAPAGLAADQSLAEMAQRLEAALRRPMAQKIVAETPRVTATGDIKAGPPKAPAQPRAGVQPRPERQGHQANLEQEMASLLSRPGKT